MNAPTVLLPVIQRGAMDCGLCCLEMLLMDTPKDALRGEALRIAPKLYESGLYLSQVLRLAARFGLPLVKQPQWGREDVGLFDIRLPKRHRHYAVWFRGALMNPADGMAWELETYLTTKRAKVRGFYGVVDA